MQANRGLIYKMLPPPMRRPPGELMLRCPVHNPRLVQANKLTTLSIWMQDDISGELIRTHNLDYVLEITAWQPLTQ